MQTFFLKLLNVSLTAGWAVAAVVVLRLVFRRSPKWIHCLLWGVVALRLLIPVHFESKVSIIPKAEPIRSTMVQTVPSEVESQPQEENIIPYVPRQEAPKAMDGWSVAVLVWGCGAAVVLLYGGISLLLLRRRVSPSLRLRDNIYCCDQIDSPFILGVFAPRIYLPSGLEEAQTHYILAHEQAHLKRKDHWWKPLAFCLLALHWFNPVLWLAYILLCRDIEKACDEKAIHNMDDTDKLGYSRTLLACSVQRKMVLACPVAFGEVSVKTRIQSVLNYRKPAFWLVLTAVLGCVAASVCLLTNPISCTHKYETRVQRESTCSVQGVQIHTCTKCGESYTQYLPLQAHVYQTEQLLHAATCTADGSESCTCTLCGAQAYRILPALAHSYRVTEIMEAPNCVCEGLQMLHCADCGAQEATLVGKNDEHCYVERVIREATCSQTGEGERVCIRCQAVQKVTYEPTPHNYREGQVFPASCANRGTVQMVCADCGKEYWKEKPKTDDHKWRDMGYYFPDQCSVCFKTKEETGNPSSGNILQESNTQQNGQQSTQPIIIWDYAICNRPTVELPKVELTPGYGG